MRRWINDEHGVWMCEPDCADEYLFDIWAIGVDYDGCQTVEEFKKLVDELVGMAQEARACLWENKLFGVWGSPTQSLYRVPSKEEWRERYCTNKQLAGIQHRERKDGDTDGEPQDSANPQL